MTKTLYDPEVERRGVEKGIEKGIEKGVKEGKTQAAINFLKLGLDEETVAKGTGLTIDKIKELRKSYNIYKVSKQSLRVLKSEGGWKMAEKENGPDSVVLIHDGVRPNITQEVI